MDLHQRQELRESMGTSSKEQHFLRGCFICSSPCCRFWGSCRCQWKSPGPGQSRCGCRKEGISIRGKKTAFASRSIPGVEHFLCENSYISPLQIYRAKKKRVTILRCRIGKLRKIKRDGFKVVRRPHARALHTDTTCSFYELGTVWGEANTSRLPLALGCARERECRQ